MTEEVRNKNGNVWFPDNDSRTDKVRLFYSYSHTKNDKRGSLSKTLNNYTEENVCGIAIIQNDHVWTGRTLVVMV